MTIICLIRHGETDWNVKKMIQGRSNIPLNKQGIHQVYEVLEGIWKTNWDVIYSSPLDRALKTAHIINEVHEVPIHTEEALIEKSFGEVEGKPYDYVFSTYPDGVFPKAEKDDEVVERVLHVFDRIAQEHQNEQVLVITHGAIIHALLAHFQTIPSGLEHIILHHLYLNTFVLENDEWTVESFNQKP